MQSPHAVPPRSLPLSERHQRAPAASPFLQLDDFSAPGTVVGMDVAFFADEEPEFDDVDPELTADPAAPDGDLVDDEFDAGAVSAMEESHADMSFVDNDICDRDLDREAVAAGVARQLTDREQPVDTITPRRPDEVCCTVCFLLVHVSRITDLREPVCPDCA